MTVTDDQLELLAAWYRKTFRKRTKAIKDALGVNVNWVDPRERVSVSEICSYAESIGMPMDAQGAIEWFHYINNGKD